MARVGELPVVGSRQYTVCVNVHVGGDAVEQDDFVLVAEDVLNHPKPRAVRMWRESSTATTICLCVCVATVAPMCSVIPSRKESEETQTKA